MRLDVVAFRADSDLDYSCGVLFDIRSKGLLVDWCNAKEACRTFPNNTRLSGTLFPTTDIQLPWNCGTGRCHNLLLVKLATAKE